MFVNLFLQLKKAKVPVSLLEYLTLLEVMAKGLAEYDIEKFYYLARATLVKDERNIDKFDRVFSEVFKGIEGALDGVESNTNLIPDEWLQKLAERVLSPEEMAKIQSLGGFEKLMETLKKRLEEQKERHQGGSKWIGTAGTSPFGAYGYNPEGIRIGQDKSRHRRAVKVWDKREFKNYDDAVEIGTRTIKVALRRLRRFAREGAATELDLQGTIRSTAHRGGFLDLKMRPERHNKVKVLLLLDVGGSMDDHVRLVEELFSAAKTEFKHFEHFYFHNCPYEALWKDNRRRESDIIPTHQVLRTFGPDWKLVMVGDASMSPYEIAYAGGAVEHWNEEAGSAWMHRLADAYPSLAWINPVPASDWTYTASIAMIERLIEGRMYPLTLEGLDQAMKNLSR